MLSLGLGEILVIAALMLVVVGPDDLPRVMRAVGRRYGQLRRAADDMRRAFVLEADRQDAEDRYRQLQERRKAQIEARKAAQEATGGASVPQDSELSPAPPVEVPAAPAEPPVPAVAAEPEP